MNVISAGVLRDDGSNAIAVLHESMPPQVAYGNSSERPGMRDLNQPLCAPAVKKCTVITLFLRQKCNSDTFFAFHGKMGERWKKEGPP